MKLKHQLIIRCLSAAALLLGLFGTLMIQLFFQLQFSREREALSAQSAALAQSLEAAAVNYALQSIPPTSSMLCELLASLDSSASLHTLNGMPLAGGTVLPLSEGVHHIAKQLSAVRRVHLGAEEYLLYLPSSLDVLYENRALLLGGYAVGYIFFMSIFAFIMLITAQHIASPIEKLSLISRRLANGEMALRAEESGAEEIRVLSHSFNQMADALTGEIERQNRFIADLTHEMKTPLTAMIGHADLIRSGRMNTEDTQLSAHQIVKEGQRLNALCARLIDLILLRKDDPHFIETPMQPLFEAAACAFAPDAESKNIRLSVQCADALAAVDPILIRLLINNLIDNALKSDARHVEISGELADGFFTLTVRDDGCGMDEESLLHITEPFYRVDKSRSRLQGGAGLGLSLCRQIAELHQTRLRFESSPGSGTIVSMQLAAREATGDTL